MCPFLRHLTQKPLDIALRFRYDWNMMMQPRKPLVVAVIATNTVVGRAELRGVEMAAAGAGWALETIDPAQTGPDLTPFAPLLDKADGVIVRLHQYLASACGLVRPQIPVVLIDGLHERANAIVSCDNASVVDNAAKELLALGRRCHVFVPMPKARRWTARRGRTFIAKIRAAGREAFVYEPKTEWGWSEERDALAKWLAALPRPMAVFAGNDMLAKFTLDACRDAGLEVPGDVAILGVNDDETLCLSTRPTLSSIRVDSEGGGRMAAELLGSLMNRGAARPRKTVPHLHYRTLGVARRGSTRPVKPGIDPGMAAGLDFIASHYGDPFLGVRDVAAAMGLGRRQAERIFRATGKSIRERVEEARLERACVLLRTTAMPLRAIAEECGFSSRPYLSLVFKKRFGKTPGEWRCQNTP
jgi:LacI family transcriptional regulator